MKYFTEKWLWKDCLWSKIAHFKRVQESCHNWKKIFADWANRPDGRFRLNINENSPSLFIENYKKRSTLLYDAWRKKQIQGSTHSKKRSKRHLILLLWIIFRNFNCRLSVWNPIQKKNTFVMTIWYSVEIENMENLNLCGTSLQYTVNASPAFS